MKKTLSILLLILLFFSCAGKQELIVEETPQNVFNPPEWILGNWIDETEILEYTFTENDVLAITWGIVNSFKEDYSPNDIKDIVVNDSEYSVTIEFLNRDQTHRFSKGLNGRLIYYLIESDAEKAIGPIYFSKKLDE